MTTTSDRGVRSWLSSWIETLRVAPPFSRRRRDLIALCREPHNPADYTEVGRPAGRCGADFIGDVTFLCEMPHGHAGWHRDGTTEWNRVAS